MTNNETKQWAKHNRIDRRLLKKHFISFVKVSAMAWQYFFFNFPHCNSMETLATKLMCQFPQQIKNFRSLSPRMPQMKFGLKWLSGFRGDVV